MPDAETLGIDAASILAAYTVRVSGYSEPLTVRMLTSASGSLYTLSEGTLTPLSFTRDGSYIVFRLDNGASIVYLLRRKPPVPAGSLAALRAAPQPPRRSS